jgi:uncharacterized protein
MNDLVKAFRAGLARGELLIQHCNACRGLQMYPRHRCIACQSSDLGFTKASGRGLLLSSTVVRAVAPRGFESELPYAIGVVRLEEGVQLLGRLWPAADSGEWGGYVCDGEVRFTPAQAGEIERRPVAWFSKGQP